MKPAHLLELSTIGLFSYLAYTAHNKYLDVKRDADDPNQIITREVNLSSADSLKSSRNTYLLLGTGILGYTLYTWKK